MLIDAADRSALAIELNQRGVDFAQQEGLLRINAAGERDLLKFTRDPARMVPTFVFPLIFTGARGGSLQATFGQPANFNLLEFTLTGVFAQRLFQTTAFGLISLMAALA
ncbi:MAG: hypothetical protein LC797_22655 [Chloroflexi bacterium]|nr:hypothetical protein [Chloroflexota bacterium]